MDANITIDDVLNVMDGNACHLKMVLGKEQRDELDQYYSLRARYCKARFMEKYLRIHPPIPGDLENVPSSIKEFWETCDRNLQKLRDDAGLSFSMLDTECTDPRHGFTITIDAFGKLSGLPRCMFLIRFSGTWKKRYAVKLVEQLKISLRYAPGSDGDYSLVVLLLGKDNTVNKLFRVVPVETVYNNRGRIKEEGWDLLEERFESGVETTREIFESVDGKDYSEIPTNPLPINCATCPFHNTIIDDRNGGTTCTGFYRPI